MTDEVKQELVILIPVVLFLTVALVGVMIVSAYYLDSNGMLSIRPSGPGDLENGSIDEP